MNLENSNSERDLHAKVMVTTRFVFIEFGNENFIKRDKIGMFYLNKYFIIG